MPVLQQKFDGFHGTSKSNGPSILSNNFNENVRDDHWFGNGVYFFTYGASSRQPHELAALWAKDQAWNKVNSCYNYLEFSVLQAQIICLIDNVLDLRDIRGLQLFDEFRLNLLEQLKKGRKKIQNCTDPKIFSILKKTLNIQLVIGHVYVKFREQRMYAVRSRLPNCTIIALNNPQYHIAKGNIRIHHSGDIKS